MELLSQLSAVSNISTVQVKKPSRPTILEYLNFTVCGLKGSLSKYILWQTATTEACERTSSCILFVYSVAESPGGKQTHSSPSTLCGCFTTYNFADATLLPFFLSRCELIISVCGRRWFPYRRAKFADSLRTGWPGAPLDAYVTLCGTHDEDMRLRRKSGITCFAALRSGTMGR